MKDHEITFVVIKIDSEDEPFTGVIQTPSTTPMQLLIVDHEGLCVQQSMTLSSLLSCPNFTTYWISCALRRPGAERSQYQVQEIQRSVENIMTHWTMTLQAFEMTTWNDTEKTIASSIEKNQKLEMGFRSSHSTTKGC